jgi:hypothetical protein
MQICSKCGVEKSLESFPVRRDRPSGRGTICLACGRVYRKAHYASNRDYYILKARNARLILDARLLRLLTDYLASHPCVDCGETDVTVLQFDHVDPRSKTDEVSSLVRRRSSWDVILAEIQKCDVRCGNCHRRRTLAQRRSGEIREDSAPYTATASIQLVRAVSSVDRAAVF